MEEEEWDLENFTASSGELLAPLQGDEKEWGTVGEFVGKVWFTGFFFFFFWDDTFVKRGTPLPNMKRVSNNIVSCLILKQYMLIASRVLKTQDLIEIRALKLVLPGLPICWCGKFLPRGDFKLLLISSLSVSQTLSKLKHRNHWNARRQTFTVHGVQRNNPHHQTLSPFLRPHSDDPLTHPLKSLKRSPSNAHRPRRATKLPSLSNAIPFPQTTFRRSPFLRPHSDVPTNGSSDFALFEGMCF